MISNSQELQIIQAPNIGACELFKAILGPFRHVGPDRALSDLYQVCVENKLVASEHADTCQKVFHEVQVVGVS